MSNGARIGAVAATIVVLVVAFVLLSPEADDDSNTADTPTLTAPATTTTPDDGAVAPPSADHADRDRDAQPAPAAEPAFERVRVRAGKAVGDVKKITVKKGERARIEVTSTDTTDEVHLHGYDISRDLKPGSRARFSFDAKSEGIFEIELEGSHTLIAQLTVEP